MSTIACGNLASVYDMHAPEYTNVCSLCTTTVLPSPFHGVHCTTLKSLDCNNRAVGGGTAGTAMAVPLFEQLAVF